MASVNAATRCLHVLLFCVAVGSSWVVNAELNPEVTPLVALVGDIPPSIAVGMQAVGNFTLLFVGNEHLNYTEDETHSLLPLVRLTRQ